MRQTLHTLEMRMSLSIDMVTPLRYGRIRFHFDVFTVRILFYELADQSVLQKAFLNMQHLPCRLLAILALRLLSEVEAHQFWAIRSIWLWYRMRESRAEQAIQLK